MLASSFSITDPAGNVADSAPVTFRVCGAEGYGAVSEAAANDAGRDQTFEFGIERILDGLQPLVENRGRPAERQSTRG